jgi:DNA gyrase subunit B
MGKGQGKSGQYTAENIKVLKGLEAIRKRPGMYMGDPGEGWWHLFLEAFDNSVDEFRDGHGKRVDITVGESIIVRDWGRGIPVGIHEDSGKSALEVIMTTIHSGGKFEEGNYEYSGGLHGVGISVVNALSDRLIATVFRNGKEYRMEFCRGDPQGELQVLGPSKETGTRIEFFPDYSILAQKTPSIEQFRERLQESAAINAGLKINLDYFGKKEEFVSSGLINLLDISKKITEIFSYKNKNAQVVLFWDDSAKGRVLSFANGIKQSLGGTHVVGLHSALFQGIRGYWEEFAQKKNLGQLKQDDVKLGLNAVVLVYVKNLQFSSQTKERLTSREARLHVSELLKGALMKDLEENPQWRRAVIDRMWWSIKSRKNMAQSQKNLMDRISVGLPTKLIACREKRPELKELFIVEGGSAGGTLKAARCRITQAIFLLRGKLLNVVRATKQQINKNTEVNELLCALGLLDGNVENLKYHKVIITVDADMDGKHIATLLIAMFAVFCPELISRGHLYFAVPPLYKLNRRQGGKTKPIYFSTQRELDRFLVQDLVKNHKIIIPDGGEPEDFLISQLKTSRRIMKELCHRNHGIQQDLLSAMVYLDESSIQQLMNKKYKMDCSKLEKRISGDIISVKINTFCGNFEYNIRCSSIEKFQPIQLDDKLIRDPQELLSKVEIKDLQHYKGLGEMNMEDLRFSCVDQKTRHLINLSATTDEDIDLCKEFMGESDVRHKKVLDRILEGFGIKSFPIYEKIQQKEEIFAE